MATANETGITYDNPVIKDDLQDAYIMISPEETPFQMAGGRRSVSNTLYEWPVVELDDTDLTNRRLEGDDAPPVDDVIRPLRLQNYIQINTQFVSVSETEQQVDAAAENVQRIAKQIALKLKVMKRTTEAQLLQNIAANPGAQATARVSAGLPAFLRTNVIRGATGTNPTLSGTTQGYPNAAAGAGTPVAITETNFKTIIQMVWDEGGEPTLALVTANNKTVISETFTGASTRYKDAIDKRLVAAIDIYTSDFGEVQVVPNRFMPTTDAPGASLNFPVYILDPNYYRVATLTGPRQKPIAETGLSKKRLVWQEVGLQVDNEKALGSLPDTNGAAT